MDVVEPAAAAQTPKLASMVSVSHRQSPAHQVALLDKHVKMVFALEVAAPRVHKVKRV